MDRIKLSSGTLLDVAVNGIARSDSTLSLSFLPASYSLDDINEMFSDESNTAKITLVNSEGTALALYTGYSIVSAISQTTEGLIEYAEDENGETSESYGTVATVTLKKPDQTESRIQSVESQVTEIQEALVELYEAEVE